MKSIQEHSVFKFVTILLIVTILIPSIVKLGHVFENHTHDFCTDNLSQTHLHTLDVDCEFYKFKINKPFVFKTVAVRFVPIENNHKLHTSQYQFISEYQRLSFALRGPPQLV
ncbi:hypothetical protein [Lacinutrix sp. WUR7]|uniref:hypothetical protein n=1 Tax=Lacinutrix sp. WUR7 TaxID=2653681 RepID=UPI001EF1195C|nr:hypothetical protein [Lacinutrix sp. WUR7]